jgi:hypothetical protein
MQSSLIAFQRLDGSCGIKMLWPIVLPFKITLCLFAAVVAAMTLSAPLLKWRRGKTFLNTVLLGLVAFIPSCAAINTVLDKHRFGVFHYATFDEVADFRVERYLPPTSNDITIEKTASGFRAKFHIKESELVAYLDDLWTRYGDRSAVARSDSQNGSSANPEGFMFYFKGLDWPPLTDATLFKGPVADNGAGCWIWYSKSQGIAYERAGYW